MSLESAAAILQAHNDANPLTPMQGANPEAATLVPKVSEESLQSKVVEEVKAEEAPKVEEAAKVEEKPETKDQQSQRFALLAKKEKQIYREAQRIKQQEQTLNTTAKAIENFENFKAEVKNNPMLALQELGISYDQLTQYVLQGKMPNKDQMELDEVRQEIKAFKESQEQERLQRQEVLKRQAERNVQQTIGAFQQEIGDYIKTNSEKYELIHLNEATNLVYSTIDRHFNDTKRLLSIEQASDIVEKYLEEQVDKNLKAKKLAARATPQPTKVDQKQPNQSAQSRTLNNNMTSSAPSLLPAKSEQERLQRALAVLSKA